MFVQWTAHSEGVTIPLTSEKALEGRSLTTVPAVPQDLASGVGVVSVQVVADIEGGGEMEGERDAELELERVGWLMILVADAVLLEAVSPAVEEDKPLLASEVELAAETLAGTDPVFQILVPAVAIAQL